MRLSLLILMEVQKVEITKYSNIFLSFLILFCVELGCESPSKPNVQTNILTNSTTLNSKIIILDKIVSENPEIVEPAAELLEEEKYYSIKLDDSFLGLENEMGKPKKIENLGKSTLLEGRILDNNEYSYHFENLSLIVLGKGRLIQGIEIGDANYHTSKGIKLGSDKKSVIKAYGKPEIVKGVFIYFGYSIRTNLVFEFKNEVVSKISIYRTYD